ncbi:MAG: HEAT repeat domain-containing protein [Gemmatimonadetes bacterium]|nr:HEAT repeat domain-containing protein [Gemmatimonadota bacterium]MBI3504481.1 HEAT repeat domain-containing protein [Pseudomonadota bacterium]
MTRLGRWAAAAVMVGGTTVAAQAQSLDRRIADATGDAVQFHFAARDGVCGNGRNWLRADEGNWYGSWNNGGGPGESCGAGPVRVVLTRAGRDVVRIEAFAGPLSNDPAGGRDLGAVSAREAADYLIGLAGSLDGRPAREALLPALLADSAVVTPALARLAKDQTRARDVRRSAMSWLARRRAEPGGIGVAAVEKALDQMVRDHDESEPMRQSALSTIGSLDHGEGVPALIAFAGDADAWVAKQAVSTLSRSGDPRARAFIREAARRTDLPEESRDAAIRGVGDEYASAADYKLLRELYPTLNSDRQRETVISTLASAGGAENAEWLLGIAKSPTETPQRRRRAISLLSRYDDPKVRDALKAMIDR